MPLFYGVGEVAAILGVAQSTAYKVIHDLQDQLIAAGYSKPKAGNIQKRFFCERYNLDISETDNFLLCRKETEQHGNSRTEPESRINPALQ